MTDFLVWISIAWIAASAFFCGLQVGKAQQRISKEDV